MTLTYGGLCEGYGGLTEGIRSVLGGEVKWYSEYVAAPSKILAHHFPGVPNLGDMTRIDWRTVEPVDVLTGGTPCQDLSHAGKRAGMTEGTRSNLWVQMREAIHVLRPKLVVWENVRGAYSAHADSDLEWCAGCMGERGSGQPVLRALGRVLGDLSDLGYDAWWYGLRAADVGAAHGRFRVFVFATPRDSSGLGMERVWAEGLEVAAAPAGEGLPRRAGDRVDGLTLLPTPAVNDMGAGKTVDAWDAWTDRMKSEHGNGNGHGKSLSIEALRLLPTPVADNSRGLPQPGTDYQSLPNVAAKLLPTPRATDGTKGGPNQRGSSGDLMLPSAVHQEWGQYEAAIRRHEQALGRPAPPPTEPSKNGQPRLSAGFVEFLMMLPEGWLTDPAIGISRNDQLKAGGNGVVPPQAAAACRMWLHDASTTQAVAS